MILRSLILTLALVVSIAPAHAGEIVIANESVSVDTVDGDTLKNVFLGKSTKLGDGTKIVFAVLSDGPASESFLKTRVGKTPSQFLSYWRKLAFSGKGTMPEEIPGEDAMIAFVKSTPGAIGYVSDATATDGVKVLNVQ